MIQTFFIGNSGRSVTARGRGGCAPDRRRLHTFRLLCGEKNRRPHVPAIFLRGGDIHFICRHVTENRALPARVRVSSGGRDPRAAAPALFTDRLRANEIRFRHLLAERSSFHVPVPSLSLTSAFDPGLFTYSIEQAALTREEEKVGNNRDFWSCQKVIFHLTSEKSPPPSPWQRALSFFFFFLCRSLNSIYFSFNLFLFYRHSSRSPGHGCTLGSPGRSGLTFREDGRVPGRISPVRLSGPSCAHNELEKGGNHRSGHNSEGGKRPISER